MRDEAIGIRDVNERCATSNIQQMGKCVPSSKVSGAASSGQSTSSGTPSASSFDTGGGAVGSSGITPSAIGGRMKPPSTGRMRMPSVLVRRAIWFSAESSCTARSTAVRVKHPKRFHWARPKAGHRNAMISTERANAGSDFDQSIPIFGPGRNVRARYSNPFEGVSLTTERSNIGEVNGFLSLMAM